MYFIINDNIFEKPVDAAHYLESLGCNFDTAKISLRNREETVNDIPIGYARTEAEALIKTSPFKNYRERIKKLRDMCRKLYEENEDLKSRLGLVS